MAAKDLYHHTVITALEKDGWTMINDSLPLKIGALSLFFGFGAEKILVVEKHGRKVAI